MRYFPRLLGFALLCSFGSLGVIGAGCSGKSIDDNDPAAMFKDAEEDIENDHYQLAVDKLREVKNKFPYSKFSIEAHLRLADVFFLQENWAEAAANYESFRDLHPKHEKTAYAMFRAAKSYFNDIPSKIARDMTPGYKAQTAYEDFIKRFPNAPEVAEARADVVVLRGKLAEKELYVADFYNKRDFYDSARPRYKKVVDGYPDTEFAVIAKEKLEKLPPPENKPEAKSE